MRIANVEGRLKLLIGDAATDVERTSAGRFAADPQAIYDDFAGFREWADTINEPTEAFDPREAGPPVPAPRQVFAVGLNYRDHAAEVGQPVPADPVVFTKYVSSFTGAVTEVQLPAATVDWEVELVAVIGQPARHVPVERGWHYVAGLTLGQDISDRTMVFAGAMPQWSLAKSFPGFSPVGPILVTTNELADPNDIAFGCEVNGEKVQDSRTSNMIWPVPDLVAYLSTIVTLLPGDVIFTGTPSGVGFMRTPQRFLEEGDHMRSWAEGIGTIEQRFVGQRAVTATTG